MDKQCLSLLCIQIWLISVCANSESSEGDLCFHQKLNQDAECKLIQDCPSALEEIKKGSLPQTCGFNGKTPVVCCFETEVLATSTTTRPTTKSPSLQLDSYFGPSDGLVGRKSYEMCRTYATPANISSLLPGEVHKVRGNCAIYSTNLIILGPQARPKEFPHMAAIGFDSNGKISYQCSGSLISDRFVLTAAYCIYSRDFGSAKYVRLGDLLLNSTEDDARLEDYHVIEAINHPDFNLRSTYNDIALLKLDRKVKFSDYIRPICLPVHKNFQNNYRAFATGWNENYGMQQQTAPLLKVTLEYFKNDECNLMIEKNRRLKDGVVDDLQICAGLRDERLNTCPGDSGGPLQIYHHDPNVYCMYMILGVTSLPKPCGIIQHPGIYTRVHHYLEWIENIVWP